MHELTKEKLIFQNRSSLMQLPTITTKTNTYQLLNYDQINLLK